LSGFTEKNCADFELLTTIFIDLLVEDQAYIFSIINLTQTQVNRSLVYNLFDLAETRSPEKTAHTMTKMFNSEKDSPFFQRIKLLGTTPRIDGGTLYKPVLSQGTVVQRMLDLISEEPKQDRDEIKKGERIRLTGQELENGLIFRQFFVEEKDWAIYKTMFNYFSAVQKNFEV
jgi:DGQHR domain-containing protein